MSRVCPGWAGQGSWAEELCISAVHRKHLDRERLTKSLSDHGYKCCSSGAVRCESPDEVVQRELRIYLLFFFSSFFFSFSASVPG